MRINPYRSVLAFVVLLLSAGAASAQIGQEFQITNAAGIQLYPYIHENKIVYMSEESAGSSYYDILVYDLGPDGVYGTADDSNRTAAGVPNYDEFYPDIYGDLVPYAVGPGDYSHATTEDANISLFDLSINTTANISTAVKYQCCPQVYNITVTWHDRRTTGNNYDVYLYDFGPDGVYGGGDDGGEFAVSVGAADMQGPQIWGRNIVWADKRNDGGDIYLYDAGPDGRFNTSAGSDDRGEFRVTDDPYKQRGKDVREHMIVWKDFRDWDGVDATVEEIYGYDMGPDGIFNTSDDGEEFRVTNVLSNKTAPRVYANTIVWGDARDGDTDLYIYDLGPDEKFNTSDDGGEIMLVNNSYEIELVEMYNGKIVYDDARDGDKDIYMFDLAPQIVPNSPLNQTYNQTPIWANVTLNENASWCGYSLNGTGNVTMTPSNSTYYYASVPAPSGSNNITFYCNDTVGSMSNRTVYFTVDTYPTVTITSPTNTTYPNTTISLNFTAEDDVGINSRWYSLNSQNETVPGNTTLNASKLVEGLNYLILYVNDSVGKVNSSTVNFTLDDLPPYVNGSYVTQGSYTGTGYTHIQNVLQYENQVINVTWADIGTDVNASWLYRNDTGANYTSNYTSSDGNSFGWVFNETTTGITVNVTVYANDTSGHVNTSFSFTYNVVNTTVITVDSPEPDKYYNDPNISISGLTTLPANVSYSINGGPNISIANDSKNFSSWNDSTVEGQNNLTVYAVNSEDSTDNDTKSISFYVDVTYPNITYNPSTTSSGIYSQDWIFVNVSINETNLDTGTVKLEVTGGPSPNNYTITNSSGTDYWINQTLDDGTYTVRVYATDLAGNVNDTALRTITLDTTAPVITIDSPVNDTISSSSADLNYSIAESNLNWSAYSLDGKSNVTLSTNKTLYNLTNGQHYVTIYANDSAGNPNSTTTWFTISADIEDRYENDSVVMPANESVRIDPSDANVTLDIVVNVGLTGAINKTLMTSNPIGTSMTDLALNKYLQIDASSNIEGNLSYAMVRVYYTNAEVSAAGISEGSMRLYKWNGSEWVRVVESLSWVNDAGVNTTGKFVWANVTSLSIFGVGGELYVPPAPPRASGGGGALPPKKVFARAILTTSEDWHYAMMAAGFAAANNYILVVTPPHSIDLLTRNKIKWFDELTILGNTLAISKRMEDGFVEFRRTLEPGFAKLNTSRVNGVDFFGTAVQLAKMWKDPKGIIVVRGDIFADALVAGQLSAATDSPILFTMPGEIWSSELKLIERLKLDVIIIGGEKAVSKKVEDAIKATGVDVDRVGGKDRYETAALVGDEYIKAAKEKGKDIDTITFLSGNGEWASTLGFRSYIYNSTILYVKEVEGQSAVPTSTKNFIAAHPYISSASIVIKDGAKPKGYDYVDAYIRDMQLDLDPAIPTSIKTDEKDYALDTNTKSLSTTVSQKVIRLLRTLGVLYAPPGSGVGGDGSGDTGGDGDDDGDC